MSISVDNIAPPSGDSWKPEVGDTAKGVILYAGTSRRVSDFSGDEEESLRIDLETEGGDVVSVWATSNTNVNGDGYAKRDAKAIAAAVRAADCTSIEVGGTLAIKRVDDVPTSKGAAKAYQAQYKPPAAAPAAGGEAAADGAVSGLL